MSQVGDSASRIDAEAAIAAGLAGKVRYTSSFVSKNYSVDERNADRAANFPVLLNFEDGAQDALGGAAVGAAKAKIAKPQLVALEWPADRPVPFSCDFNPTPDQFAACWAAIETFAGELGRPPAAYASWPLLTYCEARGMRYGWALGSSSFNTGPAPGRVLQQLATQITLRDGTVCDLNDVLAHDWGQTPAPGAPPKPTGHPPFPGRNLEELIPPMTGADVRAWQLQMVHRGWKLAVDGIYGPASAAACGEFQKIHGLKVDKVVGPVTWAATWTAPH